MVHNNIQGPATADVHKMSRCHILVINVRTLLTINFDRYKVPIEHFSNLPVLEGLMGHDMAPVAGGIADGEKYRFVLLNCFIKGFGAPGIPGDRVFRMLEQIGAAGEYQSVELRPPIRGQIRLIHLPQATDPSIFISGRRCFC